MVNKQLKILKLFLEEPTTQYSSKELSIIFNLEIRSVYRALKELMNHKLIEKMGTANNGQYIFSPYLLPTLNQKSLDGKKVKDRIERLKNNKRKINEYRKR